MPGQSPGASRHQPQAGGVVFLAVVQDDLGPEADAQDGDTPFKSLLQGLIQTPAFEGGHGHTGGPDPREYHGAGLEHHLRPLRHRAFHPQGPETAHHTGDVAGLVIDDHDHVFAGSPKKSQKIPDTLKMYQSGRGASI